MTGERNEMISQIEKDNYRESVIEIQNYLRILYKSGYDINQVAPDGIYGEETRDAVIGFQTIVGLPATGKVDIFTWDALREEYLNSSQSDGTPIFPFASRLCGDTVSLGDTCDVVYIIQVMLDTVSINYTSIDGIEIDGIFGDQTYEAVKEFQRLNGLFESGEVDLQTWNYLAETYNSYIKQNNKLF